MKQRRKFHTCDLMFVIKFLKQNKMILLCRCEKGPSPRPPAHLNQSEYCIGLTHTYYGSEGCRSLTHTHTMEREREMMCESYGIKYIMKEIGIGNKNIGENIRAMTLDD